MADAETGEPLELRLPRCGFAPVQRKNTANITHNKSVLEQETTEGNATCMRVNPRPRLKWEDPSVHRQGDDDTSRRRRPSSAYQKTSPKDPYSLCAQNEFESSASSFLSPSIVYEDGPVEEGRHVSSGMGRDNFPGVIMMDPCTPPSTEPLYSPCWLPSPHEQLFSGAPTTSEPWTPRKSRTEGRNFDGGCTMRYDTKNPRANHVVLRDFLASSKSPDHPRSNAQVSSSSWNLSTCVRRDTHTSSGSYNSDSSTTQERGSMAQVKRIRDRYLR